ncbi:peptidase S8/S53 domain-containing protein [Amylocarpus encephaloides]|uniref:Peptidase S8/S53 domain-containing protein n=1 Tax=Amylocarpus encephaloides TaxID=45428 RepID=A0A9P7YB48_9HELO|nr:peptidase S8/S53 domain-containing protein [Amylocarpus encephaloides]
MEDKGNARRAPTFTKGNMCHDAQEDPTSTVPYLANTAIKAQSIPQTQAKALGGDLLKSKKQSGGRESTVRSNATNVWADRIAREVKLQYLRSTFKERKAPGQKERNHDSAKRFLYADSQEKHICFNLLERQERYLVKSLPKGSYKNFDFDETLQLVSARGHLFAKKRDSDSGALRTDMRELFQWLQTKKVKYIIKVIVCEVEDSFHSDEAIIGALEPFVVEILDWCKPDLCPETIWKACRDVRELHLSWSGLNGMLLVWSGEDGLAKLPYLTDVYLHQTRYLESEGWTAKKLQAFENRLQKSRDKLSAPLMATGKPPLPVITVHMPVAEERPEVPPAPPAQERQKEVEFQDHKWLKTMERFKKGIGSVPLTQYFDLAKLPPELKRDVRICLIDDGVYAEHKSIMECMDGGMPFGTLQEERYDRIPLSFYSSTTNHGTLMASMIARVCPYVKIVSYRLDSRLGEDGKFHFTAKSAADALTHAANQKEFDIISMSWTIKHEKSGDNDNSLEIANLDAALLRAAKTKLVFCSAPDRGNISDGELQDYHPVGSAITSDIFKIGAARADGHPWPQVGNNKIVDYILPGHKVPENPGEEVRQDDKSPKTGSSIATALAAGLAAQIVHTVRMAAIQTFDQRKENEPHVIKRGSFEAIKSFKVMRLAFEAMSRKKDSGDLYLHVHDYFELRGQQLETTLADQDDASEKTRKWKVIAELARDLVPSNSEGKPH